MGHANPGFGWTFNPYEVALVGYRSSGKTTLAAKLVGALGPSLGYVKHVAPTLTTDGAGTVFISDPTHRALGRQGPLHPILSRLEFLEDDAVLVEEHKPSPLAEIVVLDEGAALLGDPAFRTQVPLAAVGPWADRPPLPWPVPYFCRDDVVSVAAFLRGYWSSLTDQRPLCGLVLAGGRSLRMGTDKASLDYGRGEEAPRVFGLLEEVCQQVFVSCRADQANLPGRRGLPQIHDQLTGRGPLAGLLAAFDQRPDAAWLVVACDLPRLDRSVLDTLLAGRNPHRFATAFRGHQDFPEPLCAVYEPKARPRLLQFLAAGYDCPRKMLINSPIALLEPETGGRLVNANTPEDRKEIFDADRR